jgi:hypothetical protein
MYVWLWLHACLSIIGTKPKGEIRAYHMRGFALQLNDLFAPPPPIEQWDAWGIIIQHRIWSSHSMQYERFLMRDNMRQVEERRVAEEATKEQEKDRISKEGDCFFEGHWMRSFR